MIGNQGGFAGETGIHEEYRIIVFQMWMPDRLTIKMDMLK
jgi:hypothetical protein